MPRERERRLLAVQAPLAHPFEEQVGTLKKDDDRLWAALIAEYSRKGLLVIGSLAMRRDLRPQRLDITKQLDVTVDVLVSFLPQPSLQLADALLVAHPRRQTALDLFVI